ncbi:MAG: hypothetical protein IT472_07155 [Thermomonas sp.]|uniref:hypothetical protein n=1 Tax=Thermomonas sp. TaxID=1971895 RepID=UPI002614C104|nr:hypothetical protein [Thermomonas sp.]MCC7096937.1 hypothetical protein [Thermomonas sp.]
MRIQWMLPLLCLSLVACSPEPAPQPARTPEPQAASPAAEADTTSPISETANGYKDAARNAAAQTEDAAAQEKAQLDQAAQ